MTVRDIARSEVVTVGPNVDAHGIATLMDDKGVGSVVVEQDDRPLGIVTDRDLVIEVLEERIDPADVDASDVMTPDPTTVEADAGVYEFFGQVAEASVRRVPVVDGDELVGIVTVDDLVRLLSDELDALCTVIEAESPPY